MKRYIALLLVFTLTAVLMTGCLFEIVEIEETGEKQNDSAEGIVEGIKDDSEGDPEEPPLELIIILGTHQNAWLSLDELADSDGEFMQLLARTMEYGKNGEYYTAKCHLKVIVCDGTPSEVELKKPNGKTLELYASDVNEGYIQNVYLGKLANNIVEALQEDYVLANDKEVDLVAALKEASRKFETTDREHMIYIMDTGLCTTGPMALKANGEGEVDILNPTPDELMIGLDSGDFSKLDGIRVKFRNFADFCGGQEILQDEKVIAAFEDFWRAYLDKCGVENPEVKYNGSEYNPSVDPYDASRYPTVSVVKFKLTDDGIDDLRLAKDPFDPVLDANLILNGDSVGGFDRNSHVPNDVEAAKKIAAEQKEFIDRVLDIYPDCVFYVIGSSSYVKDKFYSSDLDAAARAETVAEYLIDACVPPNLVIPIDAGSHKLPWRDGDELNEKDENQVVAIIPSYRVEIIKALPKEVQDRISASNRTN